MTTRTITAPPTMATLLDDPVFTRYMHARPRLPTAAQHGEPWRLLAKRPPSADTAAQGQSQPRWAVKQFARYFDAYDKLCDLLDTNKYTDVVLISKRRYMPPPAAFTWDTVNFRWCSRCRRPTTYTRIAKHPGIHIGPQVLRPALVMRCVLCGVPDDFAPKYDPVFKEATT